MIQTQLRRAGRNAFTLIELLIVIAIIALLISLTTAAVLRVLVRVAEVQTRQDMDQLTVAIQNFQTKYNVDYIPSRIILCELQADYFDPSTGNFKTALHQDSYQYLARVWPRLDWTTTNTAPNGTTWQGIDWNADGYPRDTQVEPPPPAPSAGVMLTGDQCLVFFLGGIGATQAYAASALGGGVPGSQGFSTNGKNPAYNPNANGFAFNPASGVQPWGDRVNAFYEFKTSRFKAVPAQVLPNPNSPYQPPYSLVLSSNGYYSYLDPYGKQPYAYFCSYKAANGYPRYAALDGTAVLQDGSTPWPISTDCPTLNDTVGWQLLSTPPVRYPPPRPYNDGTNYYYREKFQIVSAGRDQIFGPGDKWIQSQAPSVVQVEMDDIANFYDKLLGVN